MTSTREAAQQIVEQVAVGCWQFQSSGHLIELISAALAQREAAVRVEGWLPIESAPRDPGYYKLVARFEDGKLLWWEKATPSGPNDWKTRGGYVVPTHWKEVN